MDGRGVMAILAYTMGLNALALALPFSFELHKIFFVGRFRISFLILNVNQDGAFNRSGRCLIVVCGFCTGQFGFWIRHWA